VEEPNRPKATHKRGARRRHIKSNEIFVKSVKKTFRSLWDHFCCWELPQESSISFKSSPKLSSSHDPPLRGKFLPLICAIRQFAKITVHFHSLYIFSASSSSSSSSSLLACSHSVMCEEITPLIPFELNLAFRCASIINKQINL